MIFQEFCGVFFQAKEKVAKKKEESSKAGKWYLQVNSSPAFLVLSSALLVASTNAWIMFTMYKICFAKPMINFQRAIKQLQVKLLCFVRSQDFKVSYKFESCPELATIHF